MTTKASIRLRISGSRLPTVPRWIWMTLTVTIGALCVVEFVLVADLVSRPDGWRFGMDYVFYRELGLRWLSDGTFYQPRQLQGPYVAALLDQSAIADTLYPPLALALFVPFTFLPAFLWWLAPAVAVAAAVWLLRPSPWAWPVMLICVAWPKSIGSILFGNTDMWLSAFMAAGLRWGWPAVLILMKPSLAPFALAGADRKSWWVALGAMAVFVISAWPLWLDYVTAMSNAIIPVTYSLQAVPLIALPLVAWFARRDNVPNDQGDP